jgi:hypothetical protein
MGKEGFMKLSAFSFALAGGVYTAIAMAFMTVCSRLGIDGAHAITNGLTKMFGNFGYSVSWVGLVMSIILGFIVGFLAFGLFVLIYNSMTSK